MTYRTKSSRRTPPRLETSSGRISRVSARSAQPAMRRLCRLSKTDRLGSSPRPKATSRNHSRHLSYGTGPSGASNVERVSARMLPPPLSKKPPRPRRCAMLGPRPSGWLFSAWSLLLLFFIFGACRSEEAQARGQWTEPLPGVRYMQTTTRQPLRVHAVQVDLCASGISARATAPGEGPSTVSAFAELVEADVAINGDFFGEGYSPLGLAMGEGRRWPRTRDRSTHGLLGFGEGRAWLPSPEDRVSEPPEWLESVVGGRPALVRGGEDVAPTKGGLCANRHPRTAVGLSEDGRTLIILVVDGRSALSTGMTCAELSELLMELGAHDALNLDGGGSSALWIRGRGVVSRPSDGLERPVANHLAIRASGEGAPRHCPTASLHRDRPED